MGVERFESINNPLASVQSNAETEGLVTLDSRVSKLVGKGIKAKKY